MKYNDGPDNKTFNICIQNGDLTGIEVAASATAKKGDWTTIEGKYTIPNDADMSSAVFLLKQHIVHLLIRKMTCLIFM